MVKDTSKRWFIVVERVNTSIHCFAPGTLVYSLYGEPKVTGSKETIAVRSTVGIIQRVYPKDLLEITMHKPYVK